MLLVTVMMAGPAPAAPAKIAGTSAERALVELRDRDAAIADSLVRVRRARVAVEGDPAPVIEDFARAADFGDLNEAGDRLVKKLGGTGAVRWMSFATWQRGKSFKTVMTSPAGGESLHFFDGSGYLKFDASSPSRQVNIYRPDHNYTESRFSLEELDLTFAGLVVGDITGRGGADSADGSLAASMQRGKDWLIQVELGPDLALRHMTRSFRGKLIQERWYLAPRPAGARSVPRLIILASPQPPKYSAEVVVVEDVRIDAGVAEADVQVPPIPEGAVVVDYRREPPKVERFISLPKSPARGPAEPGAHRDGGGTVESRLQEVAAAGITGPPTARARKLYTVLLVGVAPLLLGIGGVLCLYRARRRGIGARA